MMSAIKPPGGDLPQDPNRIRIAQDAVLKNIAATDKNETEKAKQPQADLTDVKTQVFQAEMLFGQKTAESLKKPAADDIPAETLKAEIAEDKGLLAKPKAPAESQAGAQKGEELAAQLLVTAEYDKLAKKKRADKDTARIYIAMAKALGIIITKSPEEDLKKVRENAEHENVVIAGPYHRHETAVMLTIDGYLGTVPTIEMRSLSQSL